MSKLRIKRIKDKKHPNLIAYNLLYGTLWLGTIVKSKNSFYTPERSQEHFKTIKKTAEYILQVRLRELDEEVEYCLIELKMARYGLKQTKMYLEQLDKLKECEIGL